MTNYLNGVTDMKYTEMAQREIYNVISNYVWQLENGTMQLDKFDDETLTESQQDRLIKAMQKELGKMVNKLEKKGVIVF
tara:strand:+ start:405 stop:641 length:237 start_codon:yes stop_codon:yes gene_type:complete